MNSSEHSPRTPDDEPTGSAAATPRTARWALLVAALAVVVLLDRSTSDIANQTTLLALLGVAFAVGRWFRPGWVLAALLVGSSIAISRALTLLLGVEIADPSAPRTWLQVSTLLVLTGPALLAAGIGALLRRPSRA